MFHSSDILTKLIQPSGNIFDRLSALALPKPADLWFEVDRYLTSDVENMVDALSWWHEKHTTYPRLSQMALDYLSIPGEPRFLYLYVTYNNGLIVSDFN